jgi:hypothetical protein
MHRMYLTNRQWVFIKPLLPPPALACPVPFGGTSREGGGRGTIGSTQREHERLMAAPVYPWVISLQCPSEMTSMAPSTTLMAV